jgi:hypothetical protein
MFVNHGSEFILDRANLLKTKKESSLLERQKISFYNSVEVPIQYWVPLLTLHFKYKYILIIN